MCRVNDGRKTEAEKSLKPAGSKVIKSGNVRVTLAVHSEGQIQGKVFKQGNNHDSHANIK